MIDKDDAQRISAGSAKRMVFADDQVPDRLDVAEALKVKPLA
jgi:hypothetical protein